LLLFLSNLLLTFVLLTSFPLFLLSACLLACKASRIVNIVVVITVVKECSVRWLLRWCAGLGGLNRSSLLRKMRRHRGLLLLLLLTKQSCQKHILWWNG
jgi:hypothetical protein